MSSHGAEKQRLKQERLAREAAVMAAAQRRHRLVRGGGILAGLAIVAVVAVAVASSGGHSAKGGLPAGFGASTGLRVSAAPWAPEFSALPIRLVALTLPGQSDTVYHVHAELRVYVNGQQIPVPAQIGIDPQGRFLAPLHTHDSSGVIHIEAGRPYPFTLGQFFDVWGQPLSQTQAGPLTAPSGQQLHIFVDGNPFSGDPRSIELQPHQLLVIELGQEVPPPGYSFPRGY